MVRLIGIVLVLAGLNACSIANVKLEGEALRKVYVDKTIRYERSDGIGYEYHDPSGSLEYIHPDGKRYTGRYTISEDEICYYYVQWPGPHCWHTYTTDKIGIYTIQSPRGGAKYPTRSIGDGDKIATIGNVDA